MERNFVKKQIIFSLFFIQFCFLYSLPFTHYTSDYLRLRKESNLNSEIITVLEPKIGIEIIEKGNEASIDGITAEWVRINAANGFSGWCFSGYLLPIEKNVSEILASEVAKIKACSYPPQKNETNTINFKNITSLLEFNGKTGYYIQQQNRRIQGQGRAPEILNLIVKNEKVFVQEIDIIQNEIKILKENEFIFNGKTFAHYKSNIQIDDNNNIYIFYLENVPTEQWLGTYEYDMPYTKVPNIKSKQLINQTSDVLKSYAGVYKFDSYKIIKNENKNLPTENIENAKINIVYNESKKCLTVAYNDLSNINNQNNYYYDWWKLDFVETSSTEPFFWKYGEGAGFSEEKFWFYKGGIAISYEYLTYDFDDNHEIKKHNYIKYVVFLKKE